MYLTVLFMSHIPHLTMTDTHLPLPVLLNIPCAAASLRTEDCGQMRVGSKRDLWHIFRDSDTTAESGCSTCPADRFLTLQDAVVPTSFKENKVKVVSERKADCDGQMSDKLVDAFSGRLPR